MTPTSPNPVEIEFISVLRCKLTETGNTAVIKALPFSVRKKNRTADPFPLKFQLQDPENLDPGVKILREFKKDSTGAFYKTIFRVFSF